MIVKFVLDHSEEDEPIEFFRDVPAVPREGEIIVCDLGPDESGFIVTAVQYTIREAAYEITVFAEDMQRMPAREGHAERN